MKQLLVFLTLLTGIGYGQSLSLNCPATVRTGSPLTCTVGLVGAPGPSAIQWTLTTTPAIGPLTTTLASNLTGFSTATGPSGITVVFDTATPLTNATVATLTWAVPPTVSCAGNAPCITITMSGVFATSPGGTAVPLSAAPPVSLGVANPCSITSGGTGSTTATDVAAEKTFVITAPSNTGTASSGDRNGDGLTTVVDLQIVINAANGQACTATQ